MPECSYCVKFMPAWNKIVEEFQAEYGDQIRFMKVDGTIDSDTADRFEIESFPSFVALAPGTDGELWQPWEPQNRDYISMKKWIKSLAAQHDIMPLQPFANGGAASLDETAKSLHDNFHFEAALPVVAAQPNAALLLQQMEENKRMQEAIEQMLAQQKDTASAAQSINENMVAMMET